VSRTAEAATERVLVLTPTGRDAEMVRERIVAGGLACEVCADLQMLLAGISAGAGAVVIAQEALSQAGADGLLAVLDAQEPWSDVPVFLLLSKARSAKRPRPGYLVSASRFFERANVILLQRPLGIPLFLSSVRSAVRARRRQYQMRDLYRELEREVQLSDMFVSILGHDLRSPISAIKLAADVIVGLSPDPRALRSADRILTSADRMTRMIEQLLDFARARRGGGIPLRLRGVHLGELCRQAIEELEDANPKASFHLQEVGDLSGIWDADRLGQVITNLVGNAVQHGAKGNPITIEVDGTDASTVRLRVQNLGTVPPEALPSLFDAFKRADAFTSPSSRRTGLGLGLFIAREIARAHGGDVGVQCSDERTTFEVTLPREARPVDTGALATT
jgi:signal transduction histidine kinase